MRKRSSPVISCRQIKRLTSINTVSKKLYGNGGSVWLSNCIAVSIKPLLLYLDVHDVNKLVCDLLGTTHSSFVVVDNAHVVVCKGLGEVWIIQWCLHGKNRRQNGVWRQNSAILTNNLNCRYLSVVSWSLSPLWAVNLVDIVLSWVLIGTIVNIILGADVSRTNLQLNRTLKCIAESRPSAVAHIWQHVIHKNLIHWRVVVVTNAQTILEESAGISDASKVSHDSSRGKCPTVECAAASNVWLKAADVLVGLDTLNVVTKNLSGCLQNSLVSDTIHIDVEVILNKVASVVHTREVIWSTVSPVCGVEVNVVIVVQNVILGLRRNDIVVDYQVSNLITHASILIHVSRWKGNLDCVTTGLVVVPNVLNLLRLQ